jgi:hypothetical protein
LARNLGDSEFEVLLGGTLCRLASMAGDPDLARTRVQRGIELSERLGTTSRINAHTALGTQYFLDGDFQRADVSWEYALSLSAPGARFMDPALAHGRANAALASGNPERARRLAEEMLISCLENGARLGAIEAAVALSAALRAIAGATEADRIEEVLATADRLIAESGACNLTPFVLLERAGLAELHRVAQQRETYLREAHEAFTRMGASRRAAQVATMLGG